MKQLYLVVTSLFLCLFLIACSAPPVVQPGQESTPPAQQTPVKPIALDAYFEGWNGCGIFYDEAQNNTVLYNEALCKTQFSPYSTFKIIAALTGLKQGVLTDETSLMYYTGATYPIQSWNDNLTLKQAFQASCVWYFKQVVEQIGKEPMQAILSELSYGNGDTSQWGGSGLNPTPDINGFWLGSSLQISPKEQVAVLQRILGDNSPFSGQQIAIFKNISLVEEQNGWRIHGKTGTGSGHGWFVGFCEKEEKRVYFALLLDDPEQDAKGADAKEIALQILQDCYVG